MPSLDGKQDVVPDIDVGRPISNGHRSAPSRLRKLASFATEYFNTFAAIRFPAPQPTVLDVIRDEELCKDALEVGDEEPD
jgi:hypothetical protein